MSPSSVRKSIAGFWDYYLLYARTRVGIHAVATAALTGFGLLMYFNRAFVVLAVASYVLPPVYLYLAGDDLEDATTRKTDENGDTDADFDGRDIDSDGADADSDGADADADGADADADGIDLDADSDGDAFDMNAGSDADADADGADADADGADVDVDN